VATKRKGVIEINTVIKGRESIDKANKSMTKMKSSVTGLGSAMAKSIVTSGLFLGAVNKIVGGMKDAIRVGRDWQDWMGSNASAIDGARRAVNGIISPLELMKARTQLVNNEFNVSEKQFQALSKAAIIYSRINKTEVSDSLQKLVRGARSASDRALRELGINVELVGTKSEKTAHFVRLLEERFGSAKIEVENFNEEMSKMDASMESAMGRLGAAILDSDAFKDATKAVTSRVNELASAIEFLDGERKREKETIDEVAESIKAQIEGLERQKNAVFNAGTAMGNYSVGMALASRNSGKLNERIKELNAQLDAHNKKMAQQRKAEQEGLAFLGGRMGPGKTGGGKPFKKKETGRLGGKKKGAKKESVPDLEDIIKDSSRLLDESALEYKEFQREMWLEGMENLQLELQRNATRERALELMAAEQDAWQDKIQAMKDATKQERVAQSVSGQFLNAIKAQDMGMQNAANTVMDMGVGAMDMFAQGMWGAIEAAVEGEMSIGQAMAKLTASVLKSIAQQALVRAIFELAAGFAMLFTNPGEAGSHFIAAGLFAAAGAVAGAAGMALGKAGGAKKGGGTARTSAARPQEEKKPDFGTKKKKDEKPIVIKVFLGNQTDPSAVLHAQKQIQAQLAS